MKVRVDPECCQGHTLRAMIAPRVFELDELEGYSQAVSEDLPADQEEPVLEAVRTCPEQAISIS